MSKKEYPIPNEILIPAANQTLHDFPGYCTDKWGEAEAAHCRMLCGETYALIETDWVRARAINLRKAKLLDSVNGGPVRKKYAEPTGRYAEYLQDDRWQIFRKGVLEFWNYQCCLCNSSKHLEVHHRTYERADHNELLIDCVCLCNSCHKKVHGKMVDGNETFNKPVYVTM